MVCGRSPGRAAPRRPTGPAAASSRGRIPTTYAHVGRGIMASRQSQLHSYQFIVQRAVSALVARDPDPAQSPFRRVVGAAFASAMVAILALAGVGIYGLIVSGGKTSWKSQGMVIVERESGAKFVYLKDNKLHPVLNFASALLVAGASEPKTISVSRKSLAGAARGTPLGIPGAPD